MKNIDEKYFLKLIEGYAKASSQEKDRILMEISKIEARQVSFENWMIAFSETIDDFDLKQVIAVAIFELADSYSEFTNAFFVADELGMIEKKQELLGKLVNVTECVDIDLWLSIYDIEQSDSLKEAFFQIIFNKNPNFQQWLNFCCIDKIIENHLKIAMQAMYESGVSLQDWLYTSQYDYVSQEIRDLALRVIAETPFSLDELIDGYTQTERRPEQRAIIMERLSSIDITQDKWMEIFKYNPNDELGQLAGKKLAGVKLSYSQDDVMDVW